MRTKRNVSSTVLLGRFMMVGSTLVMAGFLVMGGMLMGAGGTGVFGERVPLGQQVLGQVTLLCGVAMVPLGLLMLRREARRFVVAALVVVTVDLVAYVLVHRSAAPMFGALYGLVLAIAYKISR